MIQIGDEVVVTRDLTLGGRREGERAVVVALEPDVEVLVNGEDWPLVAVYDVEFE